MCDTLSVTVSTLNDYCKERFQVLIPVEHGFLCLVFLEAIIVTRTCSHKIIYYYYYILMFSFSFCNANNYMNMKILR